MIVDREGEMDDMKPQKKKRYRLVFVRTRPLVKWMILLAVVLSTVAMVTLRARIEEDKRNYEIMRQYAMNLEGDNLDLDRKIEELGSIESALRIAMEELGLVMPDTVVISPSNCVKFGRKHSKLWS